MIDILYAINYDNYLTTFFAEPAKQAIDIYNLASLLIYAKVYIIVDKYKFKVLKELPCTKYKEVLSNT